jgi:hypothetical protein
MIILVTLSLGRKHFLLIRRALFDDGEVSLHLIKLTVLCLQFFLARDKIFDILKLLPNRGVLEELLIRLLANTLVGKA